MSKIRSALQYSVSASALLLAATFLAASPSQYPSEEKYPPSLVVVSPTKNQKYVRYPDGREQLTYLIEAEYPAERVLPFIKGELKKQGWEPLPNDFLNPGIPSSIQRGWTFFQDQTQSPATFVWQWSVDWKNATNDITSYTLAYQATTNSTRNLNDLHVAALFIPAEIATKIQPHSGRQK